MGRTNRLPTRLHAQVPYALGLVEITGVPAYYLPVRLLVDAPAGGQSAHRSRSGLIRTYPVRSRVRC